MLAVVAITILVNITHLVFRIFFYAKRRFMLKKLRKIQVSSKSMSVKERYGMPKFDTMNNCKSNTIAEGTNSSFLSRIINRLN